MTDKKDIKENKERDLKNKSFVSEKTNKPKDKKKTVKKEKKDKKAISLKIKRDKIKDLEEKVKEFKDKHLRLYSEFDNYRKRTLNEKLELTKIVSADTFQILLPVLDDFERGISSTEKTDDIKSVKQGINLIYNKFKTSLSQKGLKEMKCIGEVFNTDLHEALSKIPSKSKKDKGKIVDVVEKGYFFNDKVLRYAKVIIAE
jgi:molecular chaperone GrpE